MSSSCLYLLTSYYYHRETDTLFNIYVQIHDKSYDFPASNDNKTKIRKQDDVKSKSPCFIYKLFKIQRNKIHTTLSTSGNKS
jgi:hypothetical protein